MVLAEIDPVQIVIIVIAMAAGFIQWIWGLIQQSRANQQRQTEDIEDEEVGRMREEAWRRQVADAPAPSRPSPQAPRPVSDEPNPWTVIREMLEKAQEAAKPPPQRPMPPPLPVQPPPQVRQAAPPQVRQAPVHVAKPAKAAPPQPKLPVPPTPPAHDFPPPRNVRAASRADDLAALLARPGAIRQAVLLREILGPPKALQSFADAPR